MPKLLLITIPLILLLASVFNVRTTTLPVHITGHIRNNPKDTSAYIISLNIFVKGNDKVLARAITDAHGDFNLTFVPRHEKSFDFFCAGIGIDTILLASVTSFESDTPDLTLLIPADIHEDSLQQVICLKCHKADKVYKIAYGNGLPLVRTISPSGKVTYSNIVGNQYNAETCIGGIARYYCDRDKLKF
ncbi:hypothetical protein CLV51_105132 [Chitinophaga niastensis]|uniref:Uncharacterized protein n=1 Tax=Chitinophaga niastensis TaxID=536980 RepID=A0A2P8HEW0_CHINA|nr:hypothetical protein [Chitinophaga niastensis]PSL44760.1 hypothetical protein CLV51_105132 [Chitinophaga niastensis]